MPDYTKQRKSKLIQVCPKCGRKGRKRQGPTSKAGRPSSLYIHVDEIVAVAGIAAFNEVKEYCFVAEPETVKT